MFILLRVKICLVIWFLYNLQIRNGKQTAILAICPETANANKAGKGSETTKKDQLYTIYRPNTGHQVDSY